MTVEQEIFEYVDEQNRATCQETCEALADNPEERRVYRSVFVDLKREGKLRQMGADRFTVAEEVSV